MNWRKLMIWLITTIMGYFLCKAISQFMIFIVPQYFNIDPHFFINLFSRKPSLSSASLGYIIYSISAVVMFMLNELFFHYFLKENRN